MLDINVKTIDGQNRSYSVPDNYTVKQFKEKIANSLNIPIERQRLIFQGRELKDTSSLNEFDVDGKTLHLVQRLPPQPTQSNRQRANTDEPVSQSTSLANANNNNNHPDVQHIIQQLIGGLGEFGQNATFNTTNNGDSNGMEVHIDLGNVSQIVNESEIRSRIRNIRRFLTMTDARLNRLREIQSGAPLDDTPNSTIIVGSIQTTTALTDGSNIIGFETNQQNIRGPIDPRLLSLAGLTGGTDNGANISQRVMSTTLPLSSFLSSNISSPSTPASSTTSSSGTTTSNSSTTSSSDSSSNSSNSTPPQDDNSQNPTQIPNQNQSELTPDQQTQSIGVEVLAELTQSVMDAYSRFQPYLQQYHTMLLNDTNEPPESPTSTSSSSTNNATAFNFNRSDQNQTANQNNQQNQSTSSNTTTTNTCNNNNNNANINMITLGGDNRRQRFCNNINDMMHLLGHLFHNLSDLHVNIRDRPPRQMHTMNSMSHASSTIIGAAVPVEATIQIPLPMPITTGSGSAAPNSNQNPLYFRRRPRSTQSYSSSSTSTVPPSNSNANAENSNNDSTPSSNTNTTTTTTNSTPSSSTTTTVTTTTTTTTNNNNNSNNSNSNINNNNNNNNNQPSSQQHQQQHQQIHQQQQQRHNTNLGSRNSRLGRTLMQNSGGLPFPLNYSTNNSYDQYLPCNSVHFYNSYNPILQQHFPSSQESSGQTSHRRRHPAGDQPAINTTGPTSTSTTSSTTTNRPQTQESNNSQSNSQPADLSRFISNILSSTLRGTINENTNDNNQHFRVNIGGVPGQISIATISTSSNSETDTPTTQTPTSTPLINSPRGSSANMANMNFQNLPSMLFGNSGSNPLINQLFSNLSRNSQTQPQPQSNSSSSSNSNPSERVASAILREALSLMDSNNQNDNRLNQPLREFMRIFGSDDLDEVITNSQTGAPSLLNIFNIFFSSLTLGDMIDLARGQNRHRVFETTREPMRQHVRGLLGPGNEPNAENLENLVNRLYTDIFEDSNGLNIDFDQFELVENNVDFKKSFENLVKHNLKKIFEHLFDTSYDQVTVSSTSSNTNTWSFVLFKNFQNLLDQVVNLFRACVKNADTKILQLAVEKLRSGLVTGSPINFGPFFIPFESFIRNHIQEVLNGIQTNRSLVENYISYKATTSTIASSEAQISKSNQSLINNDDDNKSIDSNQFDSASSTISGHSMDIDQQFHDAKQKFDSVDSKSSFNLQKNKNETMSTLISDLPPEWIPVIEHDIEMQKTLNSDDLDRNFSDAYCSGMPAKKRKILSFKNDLLTENLFKKVLSRTLKQIQLKSNTTEEHLIEASLNQSQLIESFDSELDSVITERLRHDSDFISIINSQEQRQEQEQQQSTLNSVDTEQDSKSNQQMDDIIFNKDRFSHSRKRLK